MKKRGICTILTAAGLTLLMAVPVFAGSWHQDDRGWRYRRDDGTSPVKQWEWIDATGDGVEECFYFYDNGYMATDTFIDHYHVDNNGYWDMGGMIQTRKPGTAHYAGKTYADIYKEYAAWFGEAEFVYDRVEYSSEAQVRLSGVNFLALFDLNTDGVDELLIGRQTAKESFNGYAYELDVYTKNGSNVICCGTIDEAEMWTGGEMTCGVCIMANGGKLYIASGSRGTGAGSVYRFYTIENNALVLAHAMDIDADRLIVDWQEVSEAEYAKIRSGWTEVAQYDYFGFDENWSDLTIDQTLELIRKTKARIGT